MDSTPKSEFALTPSQREQYPRPCGAVNVGQLIVPSDRGGGQIVAADGDRRFARNLIAQPQQDEPSPQRQGHTKSNRDEVSERKRRHRRRAGSGWALLGDAYEEPLSKKHRDDFDTMLRYFERNAERMNYGDYCKRGFEIGSGAMEALHRTAGQCRLKPPGGRWLPESAQAIFNLRLLHLVGRWEEFWAHRELPHLLVHAFGRTTSGG